MDRLARKLNFSVRSGENTINTNKDKLFSLVQSKKHEGWYDSNYVNFEQDFDFDDETRKEFALISSKITGVLEICIDSTNRELNTSPLFNSNSENRKLEIERLSSLKGAYVSWGNLLRKAITDYLDIETTELTADYFVRRENSDDSSVRAGVFMVEQLENGAGYTSFLGQSDSKTKYDVFLKMLLQVQQHFPIFRVRAEGTAAERSRSSLLGA